MEFKHPLLLCASIHKQTFKWTQRSRQSEKEPFKVSVLPSFGNACLQHGKSPTHCVLIKLSHLLALVNITVEPTNIHMSLKLIVCSFLVLGRFLNFPNNTYCLIFEYMLKVHLKPQCNIFQELERYLTVYCTLSRTIIQSVCTAKNRNMHGNYHCFKSLSWSNTNINLSLGKLSK